MLGCGCLTMGVSGQMRPTVPVNDAGSLFALQQHHHLTDFFPIPRVCRVFRCHKSKLASTGGKGVPPHPVAGWMP